MAAMSICLDAWCVESSNKCGWGPAAVRPMDAHFKNQTPTRTPTATRNSYRPAICHRKKLDSNDVIGHVVWQPYWIKGKPLNFIFFETAELINVKLKIYD